MGNKSSSTQICRLGGFNEPLVVNYQLNGSGASPLTIGDSVDEGIALKFRLRAYPFGISFQLPRGVRARAQRDATRPGGSKCIISGFQRAGRVGRDVMSRAA